jgi:hypothetical protein
MVCPFAMSACAVQKTGDIRTCSGLVHSSLGRSWWDMESCHRLATFATLCIPCVGVPGKLGADGRHGRRLPVVADASERSERRRSPRGASHRPCIMDPVSPLICTAFSCPWPRSVLFRTHDPDRGLRTSGRAACSRRRCSTSWRGASSTSAATGAS